MKKRLILLAAAALAFSMGGAGHAARDAATDASTTASDASPAAPATPDAPNTGPARLITTASLIEDMIDLTALTRFPNPAYKTVQFSSYDRRSTIPDGPDWFANSDGFGREPIPNFEKVLKAPGPDGVGEYLMAEVNGPGAVVRLWTAAIRGRVRLHLDGRSRPVYEGEAESFFRFPYDAFPQSKTLDPDLMRRTLYQRDAAYAPIPFQKGMKLVWIGNVQEIHFYQIGVRLYPGGTRVRTFSPGDLVDAARTIARIADVLGDPDGRYTFRPDGRETAIRASLLPGEKREILKIEKGPAAVESLSLKLDAPDRDLALRQTVLHIQCDDFYWGQVQAPVGDFFGAAPGVNPYASLPFSVHPDGTMVCRFVMPFRESLRIVLENMGAQPVEAAGAVRTADYAWRDGESMHFRARWRADHGLHASNREVQDLPFLAASGRGVYVGTTSYLMNPSPVPTPYGNWWGEGDEKIYVDGEGFPSTFGTGSEDYYNYSWSSPDIFYFPYCGQPRNDGPGNRGFVTNFRWHILDPLPFRTGIRFDMELYPHEPTPDLSYARIGYHYAVPGCTDDHMPITREDVRPLALPETWTPAARMGARDSVFFEAEKAVVVGSYTRYLGGAIWTKGAALLWLPEKEGATKTFVLKADEAMRMRLHVTFAMTHNSGRVSATLNGKPVKWEGGPDNGVIDLRAPHRVLSRVFSLPPMDLDAGDQTLVLKFEGAADGLERPEIGVDFLWLQKAPS